MQNVLGKYIYTGFLLKNQLKSILLNTNSSQGKQTNPIFSPRPIPNYYLHNSIIELYKGNYGGPLINLWFGKPFLL